MSESVPKGKRARVTRTFPAAVFSESLGFVRKIYDIGSGQPIRRLTLFDELGKSSESSASRQLVTNSAKYGLTKGSYTAEFIEITPLGLKAVGHNVSTRECERAKIESSITSVTSFNSLYEIIVGNKLPATSVLVDKIKEFDVPPDAAEEAVDTFIVNLREVGLLKTLSGAERVISIDMRLDELPSKSERAVSDPTHSQEVPIFIGEGYNAVITADRADFETTAFYISPIGEDNSDTRRHADLFSASIVEPALDQSKERLKNLPRSA